MKIRIFFKKNIKVIISFILGMIVARSGVYAASVASSDVSYTNNSQSTVQGAIDDLYEKVPPTKVTVSGTKIFAMVTGTKGYACNSNLNGKLLCVRNGHTTDTSDFNARKSELKQACSFVGGSFTSSNYDATCEYGNFACYIEFAGSAQCYNTTTSYNHYCEIDQYGSVDCSV